MTDHVRHNQKFWDADSDAYQDVHGGALQQAPRAWGAYRVPESELRILGDVAGRAVLEIGCGAAQWSIALAADGARIVGLDVSRQQLAHARRNSEALPLVLASGEQVPFASECFDLVFCDHGALSFCEPDVIVAECARVLRPGGVLAFCGTHPLLYLTYDEEKHRHSRRLQMPYDQLGRNDGANVDWAPPPGEWIRVLGTHGFMVDRLVELVAPPGATTTFDDFAPPKWARRWPAEWIWRAIRS